MGGSGQRGGDYSRAIEKHGSASFDFRKGVRKPADNDTVEIDEGANEDSIAEFLESRNRPAVAMRRSGMLARIRRLFGR